MMDREDSVPLRRRPVAVRAEWLRLQHCQCDSVRGRPCNAV